CAAGASTKPSSATNWSRPWRPRSGSPRRAQHPIGHRRPLDSAFAAAMTSGLSAGRGVGPGGQQRMSTAFVFPGQGSQTVGIGRALAEAFAPAREAFEEVDDALKQRLRRLMFEGPESELTLTENAQPALMAVSLAAVRVIEREGGVRLADRIAFVAGHSLGEYSALAAA